MDVYLNGAFMARDKASVSVLDRGFLLGDGIYEVIPAYKGRLFRLNEHLQRLQNNLDAVGMRNPLDEKKWSEVLNELVQRNGEGDLSVYLQITRGVAERDHAFPIGVEPTMFAMATPITPLPDKVYREGVAAAVYDDDRWRHCDIKSISLLANVLLRQRALEAGFAEAILIRDGLVTEGAASNVFIVSQGEVYTPVQTPFLLPGITRDLVVELLEKAGVPCHQESITKERLFAADEVWLSSSTKEVVPVTRLDNILVGSGLPGEVWKKVIELYRNYKRAL
ncbi:MAG: D-amino acid aminotransferase [Gammaproteobacteria bacterium]|nr:D-amino acid aminotransferase [Gammaproteobacteria bacterium]